MGQGAPLTNMGSTEASGQTAGRCGNDKGVKSYDAYLMALCSTSPMAKVYHYLIHQVYTVLSPLHCKHSRVMIESQKFTNYSTIATNIFM